MTFITRFAPSPTGPLHLGHAYSALLAYDMTVAAGGQFLLRIEDIDHSRSRPEWETQIYDDLLWLGLRWPEPVMHQSARNAVYARALARLSAQGLTYPCRCNRNDIALAAGAPQEGVPAFGPDGRIYPGTCRNRSMTEQTEADVVRLDMEKATKALPELRFSESGPAFEGVHMLNRGHLCAAVGDIVLARRGLGSSYHLSVVVDDADQGITYVVRGEDLFEFTQIHVLLQYLLGLPTPIYHHHRLIRDESGKRLAKRDDARAIKRYRDEGVRPAEIRSMLGL